MLLSSGEWVALLGVSVGLTGIGVVFWQAERSRRRQYIIDFLVRAYQHFEQAHSRQYDRCPWSKEFENDWCLRLEESVRDMQLMGTPRIAKLARQLTEDLDSLELREQILYELRSELRKELALPPIAEKPRSLRHIEK